MPDSFLDDVADMRKVLELNIMTQVTLKPPTMLCIILSSQGSRAQKARGTNLKNDIMNVNFFGREGVTMITRHLVIARFSVTDKSSSALFSSLFWHFVTEKIRGPNLHVANLLIPTLLRLCPVTIYVCAWNFLRLCPSRHQNVATTGIFLVPWGWHVCVGQKMAAQAACLSHACDQIILQKIIFTRMIVVQYLPTLLT